ncbi:MAG: retropepsin-like aspartic protease, partial [archaeon]
GPIVEAHFAISQELEDRLKKDGKPIPNPVKIIALIDTGATTSVVKEEIPKALGLSPIGKTTIHTASQSNYQCYEYFMRFIITQPVALTYEGTFIGVTLDGQNIQSLIGRDFLSNGILIYIGYLNQFTLSI